MRLPDPLGFFGFAIAVDDDGLPGYDLLEVLLLQSLRSGAMERGQRVLSLKLFNSILGEVYETLHLRVLWHLHEPQGCFCHRGDRSSEDWILDVVEFVIEVVRGKMRALSSSSPAFSFTLISCPASCASSFNFILWSVLSQIVF